ncbi:MAG: efflux RND transporter permease subunit [Candidatus Limimorpha sp.]
MMKRDHIQGAMRNHGVVFFLTAVLTAFGIWSLPHLNKDEFPQFTIRQGVIVAVYPGATAQEVEQQVTASLEEFLFTYQEINKKKTYSVTEDGIAYIYAELRESVDRKDETWAKIRAGLNLFKTTSLPAGVLQIVVVDDFGSTSSVLLAVESNQRSPRELEQYTQQLCSRLRSIDDMGNIRILGQRKEEIAITIDPDRLTSYGIDQRTLLAQLAMQGFRTVGGESSSANRKTLVHVSIPYQTEYEIGHQIVFTDPESGACVRLKDIATITRRYQDSDKYVDFYSNDQKNACLIVSMEMIPDKNIVAFGEEVDQIISHAQQDFPPDIKMHHITNQPKVVDQSVRSFLKDILLSIVVVIAVMLMLFPMKTALVAGSGVPICTAITLGMMYAVGIQLHTVTLAALIVVLGMIVDNSVIIVDGYTNLLEQGHSRWYAASVSTKELCLPMVAATFAIAAMFFPLRHIITGPIGEFVQLFPFTIAFALIASTCYAIWVTPYLCTRFIRRRTDGKPNLFERGQQWFFDKLQTGYQHILRFCFRFPKLTLMMTLALLGLGGYLFSKLNIQMMPKAERNCFAVELHLRDGSDVRRTAEVADSVARALQKDERVKSVTSFVGQASPRFHATYQPQMAKPSYAQFIVNTVSEDATLQLISEYQPNYENAFPDAYLRFKQMDYQPVRNTIEVFLSADDRENLMAYADSLCAFLAQQPEVSWPHTDYGEYTEQASIQLKEDEAARLGITQSMLSMYLGNRLGNTVLTTVWEGDYSVPVVLYANDYDSVDCHAMGDILIPTASPDVWVPLRQVADIKPEWHHSSLTRRNSVPVITVSCDLRGNASQPATQKKIDQWLSQHAGQLPENTEIRFGGLTETNNELLPEIIMAVTAALLVMFLLLLYHFGKLSISVLTLSSAVLCLFGAFFGLWLFNLDVSITAVLGIVSLIGIIVRNAIMMYEYAEQLRKEQRLSVRDAAFEAGLRRMRPIFLTSATTALGVLPMIIAHTALWMPMGVVICFGTIFTLPLVVTTLPVAYWKMYESKDKSVRHQSSGHQPKQPIVCAVSLGLLLCIAPAAKAQTLTLDSCLNMARQNNHTLRAAYYEVEQAQQVQNEARTKFFPQVQVQSVGFHSLQPYIKYNIDDIHHAGVSDLLNTLYANYGEALGMPNSIELLQKGVVAGVSAVQPVWMGGKIVAGNRLAQVGADAAELQRKVKERDMLLQVEESYWLVVGLEEKRQTLNAAASLLDTMHIIVAQAAKLGLKMPTDTLKVELKQSELKAQELQLNNGIILARRALCQSIGLEYSDSLILESVPIVNDSAIIAPASNSVRPEKQLLDLQVRAAKLEKRMTLADALPQVAVGGSYAYINLMEKNQLNGSVFCMVKVPITAWWETGHKLQQHNAAIRQAEEQQAELNEQMQLQTMQAADQMMEKMALVRQQQKSYSIAEENYRITMLNYQAGYATITDLLEAHTTLFQMSNALTDAQLSARIAQRTYEALGE